MLAISRRFGKETFDIEAMICNVILPQIIIAIVSVYCAWNMIIA